MEVIGYVADTHTHAQFRWQIFSFLPLKELLWYPLTLYCSWCSARSAAFTDWWASAAAMALLQQTFACPYDFMGGRPAFGYWRFNKDFPLANFFDQSAAGHAPEGNPLDIHGLIQVTMCASWYAWLCMGFAAGAALHLYPRHYGDSELVVIVVAYHMIILGLFLVYDKGAVHVILPLGLVAASALVIHGCFHFLAPGVWEQEAVGESRLKVE
eukprot:g3038.t1